MNFLRQSTAVDIAIGPFVDATDGVTAETGLTIAQADVRLKKNNGAWAQVNDNTSATHEENGWYEKELDATDTNTCGILIVSVQESGALPVWHEFQVVEEAVYDQLFAASATGAVPVASIASGAITAAAIATGAIDADAIAADVSTELLAGLAGLSVNVTQISGDTAAADNLETAFDNTAGAVRWFGIVDQGLVQSGSGTAVTIRAGASFAADELIGRTFAVVAGTGIGQSSLIDDNDGSDGLTLATSLVTALDGTSFYQIYPTAASSGGSGPTATQIADAVWDEDTTGHTTAGTFGEQLKTDVDAILVDTGTTLDGRIPAALVNGRMDSTIDGTGMEAGAVTAVQSGLATAANLATVDTVVDAIKVQTDKFTNLPTFTAGGTGGQGYGAP